MKNKLHFLALAILMITFSSCATILGGSKKPVRVSGIPPEAEVYYNGAYVGKAPTHVKVPRSAKQGHSKITVKAPNYKSTDIELSRKWSVGYTVLDIMSGWVPLAIDIATGNIYQPKPRKVKYKLEPVPGVKFKVGDKVIITSEKYKGIEGVITKILEDETAVMVKFTRPANALEKQTKKVNEITEEKKFYYNQIRHK